jgi:hypothetical protein
MGATGAGPFSNDDALDFLDSLDDLDEGGRRERLASTMTEVVESPDYVEAPAMCEAVAAAVLVAVCDDPECAVGERNVPRWTEEDPVEVDEDLEELATRTLRRALRSDDNELWELWSEADGARTYEARLTHYLDALSAE